MQKQQSTAPKAATTTSSGAETAAKSATPEQASVGNSALQQSLPAPASDESSLLTEDSDLQHMPDKFGTTGTKTPPSSNAWGALIGRGKDVPLTAEPGKGAVVATVPDGQPVQVKEVAETYMKVTARVGEKEVTGWAKNTLFSEQPSLAEDEDAPGMKQDLEYNKFEGDLSAAGAPEKNTPTTQGGLGDCYLIASMASIHFANPDFAKRMVTYDKKKKKYTVTFYSAGGYGPMTPVKIEVDGYLPTKKGDPSDPAYAGDVGGTEALWGAIVEKAYAKWKGGYGAIEGGSGATAMAEMTGQRSTAKSPSAMKEADVVPFFQNAQKNGLAIYGGVRDSVKADKQTPFSGTGEGPYTGTLTQPHKWNEVQTGSVNITDKGNKVGSMTDTKNTAKEGSLRGRDTKSGKVEYKDSKLEVQFNKGKKPDKAADLEVNWETHGVVNLAKLLIGNHAYSFSSVTPDGLLQFYNPWGSYQPKPITAAEFLASFDSLATNQVPKDKVGG